MFNAVAMWFELRLDEEATLSTSPYLDKGPTWQQARQAAAVVAAAACCTDLFCHVCSWCAAAAGACKGRKGGWHVLQGWRMCQLWPYSASPSFLEILFYRRCSMCRSCAWRPGSACA